MAKTIEQEIKNIQTKAQYSSDWKNVVERIQNYMNEDRRTWSAALLNLLEMGLEVWENKQKGN